MSGEGSRKTSRKKGGPLDVGFPIIVWKFFTCVFSIQLPILLKGGFEGKRKFTKSMGEEGRTVLSTAPCSFRYQGSPSHSAGILHSIQLALNNVYM